jgi:hypothetical protein
MSKKITPNKRNTILAQMFEREENFEDIYWDSLHNNNSEKDKICTIV